MLHLAIADAKGMTEGQDGVEFNRDLPEYEDDYQWGMCSEMLFQDHDILLLSQGWADGVEDPDSDLNQAMRIGDLRPGQWLTTFDNAEPRDSDRGFRR